ncbi:hypothetical protein [Streptomyces sp. NPDC053560]|uniref:hypothetical protein n=1 Tax=Streptomyces sp. NPDC053560 TaxID=3365711 RepID=UPI0037D225A9
MGATGRAHRSAAWTLLVLLAVVFAPLLCRTGGGTPAATAPRTAAVTPAHAAPVAQRTEAVTPSHVARTAVPAHAAVTSQSADPVPVAASAPKRCAPHDAPASGDSAPAPATHRGEPFAAPAAVPAPYLSHDPARCALARPPTGPAPAADPSALLTVLRI